MDQSRLSEPGLSDYSQTMDDIIYKIMTAQQWETMSADGYFDGAPVDMEDGFIHFSTAQQVRETARKHFARQNALMLVSVDSGILGDHLKYEVSRGGALFPHLYGRLDISAVRHVTSLPLDEEGQHVFPTTIPE